MTDSTFIPDDNESQGAESSHDADIDAGFDSEDTSGGSLAQAAETEGGTGDSHAADVNAGYDDETNSPVTGDSGLDLGR
jgi:hypothetical protein